MKKLLLISALLTCSLQMSGCASPSSVPPPVVARQLVLPPPPPAVMVKRKLLSATALQEDLLGDTPNTTPSSGN